MNSRLLIQLYSQWSRECWGAVFMVPDATTVRQFREWLKADRDVKEHEKEFLNEYDRQAMEEACQKYQQG